MSSISFFRYGGVVALWAVPLWVFAAQLSIEPSSAVLAVGEKVTIVLTVSSVHDINTVGIGIPLQEGLTLLRSEKGLVIGQWIDLPSYDKTLHEVTLSGIIPNGWHGTAQLATFTFEARKAGTYSFAYDPAQTEIYQNDGQASQEPVIFGTISPARMWLGFAGGLLMLLLLLGVLFRRSVRLQLV